MKKQEALKKINAILKIAKPNSAFNQIELNGKEIVANNGDQALCVEFPVDLDFPIYLEGIFLKNAISGMSDKEITLSLEDDRLFINNKVRIPIIADSKVVFAHIRRAKKQPGGIILPGNFSAKYKEFAAHRYSCDAQRPNMMYPSLMADGAFFATDALTLILQTDYFNAEGSFLQNVKSQRLEGAPVAACPLDFLPDCTLKAFEKDSQFDFVIEDAEKQFFYKSPKSWSGVPAFYSVIPQYPALQLEVSVEKLREVTTAALAVLKEHPTHMTLFTADPETSTLKVSAADIDFSLSYDGVVEVKCDGDISDVKFRMDAELMIRCLKSFNCETVRLGYSAPNRAILYTAPDSHEGLTLLQMPLQITK